MPDSTATERLVTLLEAALAQADACDNTLVAALLTECIAAATGDRRFLAPEDDR